MCSRVATPPVAGPQELAGLAQARACVQPVAPYRLPGAPPDGVLRRRDGLLERVVHEEGAAVLLRAARPLRDGPVHLGAWSESQAAATLALERWRRVLGVDRDHRPFLELAWHDPVLGPLVRRKPWLRPSCTYRPHEALVSAITEQLIEYVEALRIQRGLVRLAGRTCPRTGLRDAPTPQAILDLAPAQIEALGLSARRTLLLRKVCRLLVRGLDLDDPDREHAWQVLRAIPGLGAWTLSILALRGQGEPDASPSGDLGLLKSVGRLMHHGRVELTPSPTGTWDHVAPAGTVWHRPLDRDPASGRTPLASEQQVHELVSRYSPWKGYAATHLFAA